MIQLVFPNGVHDPVDLSQTRTTVGRDKENTVVLNHEGISGFHAEIQAEKDSLYIVDMGSANGTFVNGRKVDGRVALSTWDRVRFDTVEAEVVDTEKRRPTKVSRAVSDADIAGNKASTTVRPSVGDFVLKGTSGAVAGKSYSLTGSLIVGREADCDIVIEDTMISSRHAKIEVSGQDIRITDLGSTNGTFVNGNRVTETVIKAGDEVCFDRVAFLVESPGTSAGQTSVRPAVEGGKTRIMPAADEASLKVTSGQMAGRVFTLANRRMSIGRTDDNDIALEDDTVSSSHAVISFGGGCWTVEDVGSRNGTFVNDRPVSQKELENGDVVKFGEIQMRFVGSVADRTITTLIVKPFTPD